MELSNYARIGKSPLIKAIGIQKNRKETYYTESQQLDRSATGCFSCPNYKNIDFLEYLPDKTQQEALACCNACQHCVYKTITEEHTRYINEKNMFGNAPRLKGIALKLLVIYHFKNPDDHGLVRRLSPKKLAAYLNCTVKSIRNANQKLQEYGYIMYSQDGFSRNFFQVLLTEYSSYALSAKEGGRGYATFNREFVDELVKIQDLNQLRIYLRTALDFDTNRNPAKELTTKTNFAILRSYLPTYCKPNIIKKALSSISNLFDVVFDDEFISFKMNNAFHGRRCLEKQNKNNETKLREYVNSLDESMRRITEANIQHLKIDPSDSKKLKQAGIFSKIGTSHKIYVPFKLTDADYADLSLLGSTYSLDAVFNCIGYVYENYHSKFKMQSIGALVRTILKNSNENELFISTI